MRYKTYINCTKKGKLIAIHNHQSWYIAQIQVTLNNKTKTFQIVSTGQMNKQVRFEVHLNRFVFEKYNILNQ